MNNENENETPLMGGMNISKCAGEIMGNSLCESARDMLKNAALASLIAFPIFSNGGTVDAEKSMPTNSSGRVEQIVTRPKDINKSKEFNGLSYENLKNLLANIAYNETMTDYIKSYNKDIIYAFLNMVMNRAGGDPNNIAKELSRTGQFKSFNKHVSNGIIRDNGFHQWSPSDEGGAGKAIRRIWNDYLEAADDCLNNRIPNVIGNCNMLANKSIDSKKSYNKWGKNCKLAYGRQKYGYQKDQDGYLRYNTTQQSPKLKIAKNPTVKKVKNVKPAKTRKVINHKVKSGDTLWKIAKRYKTTPEAIAKNNGLTINSILKTNTVLKIK